MVNDNKLFWSGTIAATLYWFLSEMFTPIMSLYAYGLGYSPFEISLIFAAQTFIPFFLTIQIGYFADRWGQRNMILIGAGFMVAGSTMLMFSNQFLVILLVQTLIGLGHITVWLSSQSIVTFVKSTFRDSAISRMSFYTSFGQLGGPLFGGLLVDHFNYQAVFGIYLILSLGFLVIYPFCPKVAEKSALLVRAARVSFIQTYKVGGQLYASNKGIQVATMISFSLAFILFIRVTYLPLLLEKLHYTPTQIGLFIALWSFASILIRPFTAGLINWLGRFKTTGLALILSLLGLVGFTVLPFTGGLLFSLVLVGMGTGLNQPLAISLVTTSTEDQNRGLGMGLRLMSNRLANWLCPLSLGAASHLVGLSFSFALVSVPLAVVSITSIRLLAKLSIVPIIQPTIKGSE